MKNLIGIFIILSSCILSTSCERMFGDYLQKAPGVDVTIDTIFSSRVQVETLLANIYEQGLPEDMGVTRFRFGNTNSHNGYTNNAAVNCATCDEGNGTCGWMLNDYMNLGLYNVGTSFDWDQRYNVRWYVIRQINSMLERVDMAPIDKAYADQIKAEVKFIRAINYFEAWKLYGGMPIVTKPLLLTDNLKIPQSSIDSTMKFIVKDCDDAIAVLPNSYPSNLMGRITKGAALALKAKALLYAASPLWNSATPPISMANPVDNRLLCYGNYDVNRWKLAADAAKAVLDWAPSGGIQLITDKGVDNNYAYTWEVNDNTEIILANQVATTIAPKSTNDRAYPWGHYGFPFISWGWTGIGITQNFIEKFYDRKDGTPQTWPDMGNDLNLKYSELDPRFKQSVNYNGNTFNSWFPVIETFLGPSPAGKQSGQCITGTWMRKPIPRDFRLPNGVFPSATKWPIFRLADAYLWYAEALNEFNSSPPKEAYDAINIIRARSGMPNIPTGLSQSQFRQRVVKERAVEFFMENSRLFDVLRWRIAEQDGIMQGDFYGLKIYKIGPAKPVQEYSYQKYVFEKRIWNTNMYHLPHIPSEVNKGTFKQNPGW